MNKRFLIIIVFAAIATITVGMVYASTTLSIQVTDSHGNDVTNKVVPVGTTVNIIASFYSTDKSTSPATLTVYFNNGAGSKLVATLYSGTVSSGGSVKESFNLTNVGTYTFKWNCTFTNDGQTRPYLQSCEVITDPQNTVPEPVPLFGLTIGLLALGFFALKAKRAKRQNLPPTSNRVNVS